MLSVDTLQNKQGIEKQFVKPSMFQER